jgi:hypothetical protein
MAVELAPSDPLDEYAAGPRCVCGHGILWHKGAACPGCDEECECRRYRPAVATDGQIDGSWAKGAEGGASMVDGHLFMAGNRPHSALCAVCHLSEAAHTATTVERP